LTGSRARTPSGGCAMSSLFKKVPDALLRIPVVFAVLIVLALVIRAVLPAPLTDKASFIRLIIQVLLGMIIPLGVMVTVKLLKFDEELRKLLHFVSAILIQLGICATRGNVVIGGQMFSKSFRGLTSYKMDTMGMEGLLTSLLLMVLPFVVLAILIKILPPWQSSGEGDVRMKPQLAQ
jgi:hypothetical protein